MEEILLSIGSVCTLKGRSEKIMITGYLSVEYKNQVEYRLWGVVWQVIT